VNRQPTIANPQPAAAAAFNRRAPRSVTIKAALMLSGVLTLVFLISFMFSEQGISELQRSRARVQTLQSEIDRLESENARLEREIESLKRSTFAVERIAREDLSMSRPGEFVYVLPPEQPAAPPATRPSQPEVPGR
jgi:cell division protein FtsL